MAGPPPWLRTAVWISSGTRNVGGSVRIAVPASQIHKEASVESSLAPMTRSSKPRNTFIFRGAQSWSPLAIEILFQDSNFPRISP